MIEEASCHDCGVPPNSEHIAGCDVERCSVCGGQKIGCNCEGHDPAQAKWTGEWPGVEECRRLGFWCVPAVTGGYRPCDEKEPGAREDLNRLAYLRVTGRDGRYRRGT